MSHILTVSDIARLRGTDRSAAWRWLRRNAGQFLRRDGRFVVISKKDYGRVVGTESDPRLDELESRIVESERRLDAHARALSKLNAL